MSLGDFFLQFLSIKEEGVYPCYRFLWQSFCLSTQITERQGKASMHYPHNVITVQPEEGAALVFFQVLHRSQIPPITSHEMFTQPGCFGCLGIKSVCNSQEIVHNTNSPEKIKIFTEKSSNNNFQPNLLHEGQPLRAGEKWLLRTDVMFRCSLNPMLLFRHPHCRWKYNWIHFARRNAMPSAGDHPL